MSIRPVHVVSSLAAPLAFFGLTLVAPSARADQPPKHAPAAQGSHESPKPWARRFPSRSTAPAVFVRPRVPAQAAAPGLPARPTTPAARPASTAAPTPAMVAIEIREIRPGAPTQIERFALPLGDSGSSKIESRVGEVEYRIGVHRESSGVLGFDVRKSQRGQKAASSEAQVRASVRLSAGQHVVIASMDRADGSRTEVLAQVN